MPFQCFQKHSLNKSRLSDSLNGQRWRFLQSGLDDFREGFPPPCDNIVNQRTKGPIPIILPSKPERLGRIQQRTKRMPTKPQTNTSKLSPMLQARKECIAHIEYCLSQHLLALYPHLEESIPPELFKEVLSVLDPEMLAESEEADVEVKQESQTPSAIPSQSEDKRKRQTRAKLISSKDPKGKDPYKWFSKTEVAAREREARLNYIPPLDENVKQATKEFCRWFDSLGGKKHDVDESTIISLFDASYETRPPSSVPIHVVELHDLPTELRKYVGMPPPQSTLNSSAQQGSHSKESCQSKRDKIRYGAWYLDPKTWRKQKVNEPLEDPRSKEASIRNSRRALSEKDMEIMQLHGTRAFKEFLEEKGSRIPDFLQQILAAEEASGPNMAALKGSRNGFQRCEELREDSSSTVEN
ncbi:protein FAM47E-like [Rhineura floridana]|uniref:protein FAM47E-like n=1 Tax=Rhineura floridana TaxID=261503 RepID=UPI002AC846AC|nr:protein FAM47E-like [Rhineura floridana]